MDLERKNPGEIGERFFFLNGKVALDQGCNFHLLVTSWKIKNGSQKMMVWMFFSFQLTGSWGLPG